jgi:hypothetical protein
MYLECFHTSIKGIVIPCNFGNCLPSDTTIYPVTQQHYPGDLNLQQHCYEKLNPGDTKEYKSNATHKTDEVLNIIFVQINHSYFLLYFQANRNDTTRPLTSCCSFCYYPLSHYSYGKHKELLYKDNYTDLLLNSNSISTRIYYKNGIVLEIPQTYHFTICF